MRPVWETVRDFEWLPKVVHTENIGGCKVNLISWETLLRKQHTEKNTDHYSTYSTYIHM